MEGHFLFVPISIFIRIKREIKNILHYAVKRYTSVAVRKKEIRIKNIEKRLIADCVNTSFLYFLSYILFISDIF